MLWILFGTWLWSYRVGRVIALAVLIGVTMIFNGRTENMVGADLLILRWFLVAVGVLSVVGGVTTLSWPGPCRRRASSSCSLAAGPGGGHVRSLFLFINLAAAFAAVRGVRAIFTASRMRRIERVVATAIV